MSGLPLGLWHTAASRANAVAEFSPSPYVLIATALNAAYFKAIRPRRRLARFAEIFLAMKLSTPSTPLVLDGRLVTFLHIFLGSG